MSEVSAANVAMLLTPPGSAAIAVVRLAGPAVAGFLAAHFSAPTSDDRCVHGTLRDESGDVLDDPVIVCSREETVADLNLHGGLWVVESVFALAGRFGFERVDGSETVSAFDADSIMEREVLSYLPQARTELALRTLLAQPAAWTALMAACPSREVLTELLGHPCLMHLLNPPRVAIVGVPNVGKSTLANRLFGQDRSITADVPGTTRDWVGATANIDGLAVTLVDTPGIRETEDPVEQSAIEVSRREINRADLVMKVRDSTRLRETDVELDDAGDDTIEVYNKTDIDFSLWRPLKRKSIKVSALTGFGMNELRDMIREHFRCGSAEDFSRAYVWTQRQREEITSLFAKTD